MEVGPSTREANGKEMERILDKTTEFETMALELMALNLAFDSARIGEFSEELMELSEEAGEEARRSAEPGSSGSV